MRRRSFRVELNTDHDIFKALMSDATKDWFDMTAVMKNSVVHQTCSLTPLQRTRQREINRPDASLSLVWLARDATMHSLNHCLVGVIAVTVAGDPIDQRTDSLHRPVFEWPSIGINVVKLMQRHRLVCGRIGRCSIKSR